MVVGRALDDGTGDSKVVAVELSVGMTMLVSRVVAVELSVGITLVSSTLLLVRLPPVGEFSVVLSIGAEVVKVMNPLVLVVGKGNV